MVTRLPTFLHIGPGKSGSSWLHETLARHPEVYLSEAKDLYFFSRYYDRGLDWYRKQFRSAGPGHRVVGEVCPDYLSCAEAPRRIRSCLGPDVRLMVTLRDPAERAFSAYLHRRRHGEAAPTFSATWTASAARPSTWRCSTTWVPTRRPSSTASPAGCGSTAWS